MVPPIRRLSARHRRSPLRDFVPGSGGRVVVAVGHEKTVTTDTVDVAPIRTPVAPRQRILKSIRHQKASQDAGQAPSHKALPFFWSAK